MTLAEPRRKKSHTFWRVLFIVLITFILLLIVLSVLLVIFVQSSGFEKEVQERVLPQVSEKLQRKVTVGEVDLSVFPRPTIRLGSARVEGLSSTPLFTSKSIDARLRVWPLIRSRGKHLVLSSLFFDETTLNLVRLQNGEWDIPKMEPRERETAVDLEQVLLRDGSFFVVDERRETSPFQITNLQSLASFQQGVLLFRSLSGESYGADLDAGGSQFDLGRKQTPWSLRASVDGLELQQLPGASQALQGILGTSASLTGVGTNPQRMRTSVSGDGDLGIRDMVWTRLDLRRALATELAGLFQRHGINLQTPQPGEGTSINDLQTAFRVEEGWVSLENPITFASEAGETTLGGRVRLDLELDLEANTLLTEEFVSFLTNGEVQPEAPVPLIYRIRGTFSQPRIEEVDPTGFVPVLAGEAGRRIQKGLEKILPPLGTGKPPPTPGTTPSPPRRRP